MSATAAGRYDSGMRRQAVRRGRERGCWLYIPAEELAKTGRGYPEPPPFYRTWAGDRGRVVIQLYGKR